MTDRLRLAAQELVDSWYEPRPSQPYVDALRRALAEPAESVPDGYTEYTLVTSGRLAGKMVKLPRGTGVNPQPPIRVTVNGVGVSVPGYVGADRVEEVVGLAPPVPSGPREGER